MVWHDTMLSFIKVKEVIIVILLQPLQKETINQEISRNQKITQNWGLIHPLIKDMKEYKVEKSSLLHMSLSVSSHHGASFSDYLNGFTINISSDAQDAPVS